MRPFLANFEPEISGLGMFFNNNPARKEFVQLSTSCAK